VLKKKEPTKIGEVTLLAMPKWKSGGKVNECFLR
jgi:hypothetical protein